MTVVTAFLSFTTYNSSGGTTGFDCRRRVQRRFMRRAQRELRSCGEARRSDIPGAPAHIGQRLSPYSTGTVRPSTGLETSDSNHSCRRDRTAHLTARGTQGRLTQVVEATIRKTSRDCSRGTARGRGVSTGDLSRTIVARCITRSLCGAPLVRGSMCSLSSKAVRMCMYLRVGTGRTSLLRGVGRNLAQSRILRGRCTEGHFLSRAGTNLSRCGRHEEGRSNSR